MSAEDRNTAQTLRQRAEALLHQNPEKYSKEDIENVKQLAHELSVFQAELDVQNEELRNTQFELQQARDHFSALFEDAPVGYVVLDGSGIIRQTNSTWRKLLGKNDVDFRGRAFSESILPEDAPIFLSRFRAFFRNPAEKRILVRMKRQPRGVFHAQIEAKPRPRDDGDALAGKSEELLVIVSDVTEQQKAREAVQENESNLRITLQSIGDAVIATDDQGCVQRMNPVAEKLTGWSLESARGLKLEEVFNIVNAKTGQPVANPVKKVLQTGATVGLANHTQLIARNGETYQIADSGAPIRNIDGKVAGVVLVFRDVTEDYHIREALKENERRMTTLLANLPGMAYRCKNDVSWTMEFVSEGCLPLTGYRPEELTHNASVTYAELIHPDDREQVSEAVQAALKEDRPFQISYRICSRDGAIKWVWEQGKGIPMGTDGQYVIEGFIADTTERKQAEQAIKKAMQDLQAAKDLAENANRAKDEFLAVMSHEMRTPLNPIVGFTSLLLEEIDSERHKNYLETVLHSAEREVQLIENILQFTRLNKDVFQVKYEWFSILPACKDSLIGISPITNIEVRFEDLPGCEKVDASTEVYCDRNLLLQLLDNLLTNAVKYTHQGSITLRLGMDSQPTAKDKHRFIIAVEDTGIGMSTDLQQKIFEPFTQADSSLTRKYQGMGLGLAICKRITEILGATITVESTPDTGSTFEVGIELVSRTEKARTPVRESSERLPAVQFAAEVLVVEDNPDNTKIIQALLRKHGSRVTAASNGREAVETCRERSFDLILMDLSMPVMDGIEATQTIRSQEGLNRQTPIVALTADARVETRKRCEELGMEHFLTKPVTPEHLRQTLGLFVRQ